MLQQTTIDMPAAAKALGVPEFTRMVRRHAELQGDVTDHHFVEAVVKLTDVDEQLREDVAVIMADVAAVEAAKKWKRTTDADVAAAKAAGRAASVLSLRVMQRVQKIKACVRCGMYGVGKPIAKGAPWRPSRAGVHVGVALFPRTRAEACAWGLALLLDVERGYGEDLRRCPQCGKFFVIARYTGGRPRDVYCTGACRDQRNREDAKHRVARHREKAQGARR